MPFRCRNGPGRPTPPPPAPSSPPGTPARTAWPRPPQL
ncbi:hypothetical protein SCATT_07770 [Streptantibioticus cattleyicolor NRRL 8057 = DSM 46488]|uniref:Uncharacterized protein n=1 Tax=Streptantibioticus cattleyicolor (strain ATCC 35852 / DSM 46488 / JCM 4925 / NBRC 14057 / NRRL 8057) TaxID=1003195 RepID=G8WYW3_STREN|nr:hypothetical protein SCATT_07770 [Streptantibioticus cattleyicolor NRRL 8057 = DSM 46488]